ncbi:MAG: carboxypeptidase-like regulatory domain-containing protein, partial [Bacteroidales bacterium]|nr:carboxypeptidase-like regulatory domain-containing protein [Bacteroidales bacterium]
MKKIIINILLLILNITIFSQTIITVIVKDADTKEALPYCNVAVKGTSKGGITNIDGAIKLNVNLEKDSIEISFLGYKTKTLKVNDLKNNTFFMTKQSFLLNEVEVFADNDYLYDIIQKCRKKMLNNSNKTTSKTYFSVETSSDNKILEFLESYYNANFSGYKINRLDFKNGKTNLNINIKETLFLSYNTAIALQYLDLLYKNDYFPSLILQSEKSFAKRMYVVNEEEKTEDYYRISFKPRKKRDKNKFFSGNLWIDKNSFALLKISLIIDSTDTHPFEPRPFL